MQDSEKKFFDVNRQRLGPQPTSKPIIVGHQPTMPDPMVREVPSGLTDLSTPQETNPALTPSITPQAIVEPGVQPPSSIPEPTSGAADLPAGQAGGGELTVPAGQAAYHHKPRVWVWVIVILLILAAAYAAVDAKTDILPFHIFSHAKKSTSTSQSNSKQSGQPIALTQSNLPAGFSQYQPTGTNITFAYPTAWGTPATTADPGFSQRGSGKQSDGTYAYLVNFATNKDIQAAITSSKYLPPARTPLYYDFLQWCTGTNDGKFYKQTLHFTTTNGIDSPSTITCDQGPLTDATKINDAVILQHQTKDATGAALGDVYTANLSDSSLPVLRVKDAKMANSDDIKKLLNTISSTTNSSQ